MSAAQKVAQQRRRVREAIALLESVGYVVYGKGEPYADYKEGQRAAVEVGTVAETGASAGTQENPRQAVSEEEAASQVGGTDDETDAGSSRAEVEERAAQRGVRQDAVQDIHAGIPMRSADTFDGPDGRQVRADPSTPAYPARPPRSQSPEQKYLGKRSVSLEQVEAEHSPDPFRGRSRESAVVDNWEPSDPLGGKP